MPEPRPTLYRFASIDLMGRPVHGRVLGWMSDPSWPEDRVRVVIDRVNPGTTDVGIGHQYAVPYAWITGFHGDPV